MFFQVGSLEFNLLAATRLDSLSVLGTDSLATYIKGLSAMVNNSSATTNTLGLNTWLGN